MIWHVSTNPTKSVIWNPLKSGKLFFTLFNCSWPSLCCCTIKLTMTFRWNFHSLYPSFIFLMLAITKAIADIKNIIEKDTGPYNLGLSVNWTPVKTWKCTASINDPRKYLESKRKFYGNKYRISANSFLPLIVFSLQ